MENEIVCENYEITIGEDGAGVALTFDLDDLPDNGRGLAYVNSLSVDDKGFHTGLSTAPGAPTQVHALFPLHEGMDALLADIREQHGQLYIAALGPGAEPDQSAVIFARQMPLA